MWIDMKNQVSLRSGKAYRIHYNHFRFHAKTMINGYMMLIAYGELSEIDSECRETRRCCSRHAENRHAAGDVLCNQVHIALYSQCGIGVCRDIYISSPRYDSTPPDQ